MTNRQLAALETKKRLLEAGKCLICEKGLANTAIEEITAAAGVSKGTFYTYFNRKEDILFELSRSMFGEILEAAKEVEGDFIAKMQDYMVNFSGYIEQGGVKMAQEWVKNVVNPDFVENEFDRGKLKYDLKSVHDLIQFSVSQGTLRDSVPAQKLSEILVDLLYGQMLCWSMSGGVYSLRARTEDFCDFYLRELFQVYMNEEDM
ncbi:MAG: TetR/AcrR family transcriptional regulator [Lachnospiraceae bacterium]|nr:TetR/AcrR family transcriptional regulator [Lachnospiraceae bacterium]